MQPHWVQQPDYAYHAYRKYTNQLGIHHYNGKNFGSQWCPLLRGSTVRKSSLSMQKLIQWWTMTYMENVMKFHAQNNKQGN